MTHDVNGRSAAGSNLSDEELMQRLAGGSRDAIGTLHGRYAALIFGLAARSLGHSSAEEIVQDVFVAVWQKAHTFDPARGTFRAWAMQITQRRVINELRRRGRRPPIEADPEGIQLGNLPETGAGPEEAVWLDHRRAVVRAAVDALPPPERQALSLAFLEDLTHQQVAESLDLPLGTAKTRIRSGLRHLRKRLAPLSAAGLLALAVIATVLWREGTWRNALRRDEAALRLVTSSDVVPRRLVAAPGTPTETHGHYRGRPGVPLAVTTVSRLSPAPSGRVYRAWGRFDGRWHLLGTVRPDEKGAALFVSEGSYLTTPPTSVMVTLEPTSAAITAPTGTSVIVWPSQ